MFKKEKINLDKARIINVIPRRKIEQLNKEDYKKIENYLKNSQTLLKNIPTAQFMRFYEYLIMIDYNIDSIKSFITKQEDRDISKDFYNYIEKEFIKKNDIELFKVYMVNAKLYKKSINPKEKK